MIHYPRSRENWSRTVGCIVIAATEARNEWPYGVRGVLLLIAVLAVLVAAHGCRRPVETPQEVAHAYSALLASLDASRPGDSVARLQNFATRYAAYPIAQTVAADITPWRRQLEPAYLKARDLARDGRFDEAQTILVDLAQLQDEPAGRMAREFLSFEFHQLKASQLLVKGDTAAARAAGGELRKLPLNEGQRASAERLLDSVGLVDGANRMTRTTALQSAARMIQVALHGSFAEEGRYPELLDMASPVLANLRATGVLSPVARIDNYTSKGDEFSLIVSGADGQRIRVTHTGLEPIPGALQK